jgi:RES domain-containing protein
VASDSAQTALPISAPGIFAAFRYCSYDVPFWARPNTRAGRWNRENDPPTQYWALTPDAAWAELIRAEDLKTEEDLDLVRMPLWVCRVPVMSLVDLREPDQQQQYGLDQVAQMDDDWSACQEVAPAVRADAAGVITYSAALDHHWNLTLFAAKRAIDWRSTPALASTLPATIAALGRPPRGLVDEVRRPQAPIPQDSLF